MKKIVNLNINDCILYQEVCFMNQYDFKSVKNNINRGYYSCESYPPFKTTKKA
ncbi:MAG: hypothetical protein SOT71_04485 [Romboutsia timonensis]|uniref:hypothetical protein n=1 Tax=Romboutsia timonensis TaxID=1776391 RepID=UPI002A75C780|nr:hypothetical protein [Romboutsia timonensis]MDY2881895.1 hypothetical protein [Romboutsia timonensis]